MKNQKKMEWEIMEKIAAACSKGGDQVFENRIGTVIDQRTNQYISFGVGGKGAADLIGWKTIEITPDMMGKKVAVFCAIEVKRPGLEARTEQKAYLKKVDTAGGIAGVAHSVREAKSIIAKWLKAARTQKKRDAQIDAARKKFSI